MENIPASSPEIGRPTLCTDQTLEVLCSFIRLFGAADNAAAAHAGLHRTTLWRWKQSDPELPLRLAQARERFRQTQLMIIMEGRKGWRAAAWLLERIFPADYHPRAAERARHQLAETEAASAAHEIPATPSEPMLQNSPATTQPPSPVSATFSEPVLQKSSAASVPTTATSTAIPAPSSEPLLQNPLTAPRKLSRKDRRALERRQQRAKRSPAADAA